MKRLFDAEILRNAEIKSGIFDMLLQAPGIASEALPGQFVNVYLDNPRHLLPRPFSICQADGSGGAVRIVYRVAGEGTAAISRKHGKDASAKREGDRLRVGGPVGNGFRLPQGKRVLLAGGGVGAPPLLFLAERLRKARPDAVITAALGFRTESQVILDAEFGGFCDRVIISTDDGSRGESGSIVGAIARMGIIADEICACGPKAMLRAIAGHAAEEGMPVQVSLEERMACGIGACLGCAVRVNGGTRCGGARSADGAPYYQRVCVDGPVFDAREVVWDE